ncbi:MAG: hypothetical protein J6D42_11725 [Clostridia bacterium]|nr:hypothetical protein [Clostridia bacterium]
MQQITDMETWVHDNEDRIYRYLIYKKVFTPYEQQSAFIDESIYENSGHYTLGKLTEAIDLGNDWLLGFRTISDDGRISGILEFVKLSEIRLEVFDYDQDLELYEDEEE